MPYVESPDKQRQIAFARQDKVLGYLARASDEAQRQRLARWQPPAGMTAEQYELFTSPLRQQAAAMIGYPPPGEPVELKLSFEQIGSDDDGTFYRVTMPLLRQGLEAYGILLRPHKVTRATLALAIHGGGGNPEVVVPVLEQSWNYNDMGRRLARRGHVVWAPAAYETLVKDDGGKIEVHLPLDRRARMIGTTLVAIDAYSIIRSTDAILACGSGVPVAGGAAFAGAIAVGLSYGGLRALVAPAMSPAFVASVCSCYFSDRRKRLDAAADGENWNDMMYEDVFRIATDVEFCQLICPRPLFIENGKADNIFSIDDSIAQAPKVQAVYEALGIGGRFGFEAFEGGHEFSGVKALEFLDRQGL